MTPGEAAGAISGPVDETAWWSGAEDWSVTGPVRFARRWWSEFPSEARWLDAVPVGPKFYWKSRRGGDVFAAIGEVKGGSLAEMKAWLGEAPLRLVGGRAFDRGSGAGLAWPDWPEEYFYLPRWHFQKVQNGAWVTGVLGPGESCALLEQEWLRVVEAWGASVDGPGASEATASGWGEVQAIARQDEPDYEGWQAAVETALGEIASGHLTKVVLARHSELELSEEPPAFALLDALGERAGRCFQFAWQPDGARGTFLGTSPELLFRRQGRSLQGEAVAGTRGRSLEAAEEERLEAQLRQSDKELHEHGIVVAALRQAFAQVCEEVSAPVEPGILKLARVQHLLTPLQGQLRDGVGVAELLDLLHPTPATGGYPAAAAREFLRKREKTNRGWYAGPLGWVLPEAAEFCVAIRSARVRGSRLDLWAGAGVVPGSEPEKEWAELESKIAGPLRLLTP
jgi:menaquinone-specific isochorismate synthase